MRSYEPVITSFCRDHGNLELEESTVDLVQDFLVSITNARKLQTRKIRFAHLTSFFNFVHINLSSDFLNHSNSPVLRKLFRTTRLHHGKFFKAPYRSCRYSKQDHSNGKDKGDMKKLTWTIVIIFLLLSAPVAAQFYRYFDEDGYLRFTDDLNKVPPEQRANIRKYRGAGSGSATFSREDGAEIEESQRAGTQPSENQVFGSVATAPEATVSLKDLRTQIEKMKEQVEAEYLALVNAKDSLAKQRDIKMTQEDLGAYNRSVDEFNQRAINYERMSSALSEMVGEFNAIVLEENVKLSNR